MTSSLVPADRIDEVLSIFNSIVKRLQFTHEIETENQINFLDVFLKIFWMIDWLLKITSKLKLTGTQNPLFLGIF